MPELDETIASLNEFAAAHPERFATILIDPPWRFTNRTSKVAPEHRRLAGYETLSFDDLGRLPIGGLARPASHLYL